MIYSSLKRDLFIICLLVQEQTNLKMRKFQGSRSEGAKNEIEIQIPQSGLIGLY
jgi:hypothetical protein